MSVSRAEEDGYLAIRKSCAAEKQSLSVLASDSGFTESSSIFDASPASEKELSELSHSNLFCRPDPVEVKESFSIQAATPANQHAESRTPMAPRKSLTPEKKKLTGELKPEMNDGALAFRFGSSVLAFSTPNVHHMKEKAFVERRCQVLSGLSFSSDEKSQTPEKVPNRNLLSEFPDVKM